MWTDAVYSPSIEATPMSVELDWKMSLEDAVALLTFLEANPPDNPRLQRVVKTKAALLLSHAH